jgi:hypothetical protein
MWTLWAGPNNPEHEMIPKHLAVGRSQVKLIPHTRKMMELDRHALESIESAWIPML